MSLQIIPTGAALGAEVTGVNLRSISEREVAQIRVAPTVGPMLDRPGRLWNRQAAGQRRKLVPPQVDEAR